MKRFVASCFVAFGIASPLMAQENLGYYLTTLGPADFTNSNGARLTDFCAIVQQDRANYHRFGVSDPGDEGDGFFADRANRSVISQDCRITGWDEVRATVLAGRPQHVVVQIYGSGSRVAFVIVGGTAG